MPIKAKRHGISKTSGRLKSEMCGIRRANRQREKALPEKKKQHEEDWV